MKKMAIPQNNPSTIPNDKTQTPAQAVVSCELQPAVSLQAGMICPRCGEAVIDYDGLLQLVCPNCGLKEAGACT
jgi:predicted RNA-binding Zn-ribbon protein involved in translation (DUF1610 family)